MMYCTRCLKPITDKKDSKLMLGQKWHSSCFSCETCGIKLGYGEYKTHLDRVFCYECHFKQCGPADASMFMSGWKKAAHERIANRNKPDKNQLIYF